MRLSERVLAEGLVVALSNHYITRPIYIASHNIETGGYDIKYQSKQRLNINAWRIMDNDYIDFQCVISQTAVTLNRARTLYNVYVVARIRGPEKYSGLAIVQGALIACDEINESGGLLGYTLFPKIYGYAYDYEYPTILRNIMSTQSNCVFIGGLEYYARDSLSLLLENSANLFLFAGVTLSDSCYQNIISIQSTGNQIVENIMYTVLSYQSLMITLVSNGDNFYNLLFIKHLEPLFLKSNIVTEGNVFFDDIIEVTNRIVELLPEGGLIITLLETMELKEIAEKLFNEELTEKYKLVIGYFNDDLFKEIDTNKLKNHLLLGSAFPNLKSTANIILPDKAVAYLSLISENFGENGINTPLLETSYVGIYLLSQLINIEKDFQVSRLLSRITEVINIGPSNVKFSSNLAAIRRMYAGRFDENALVLIHGPGNPIKPQYTPSYSDKKGEETCLWLETSKEQKNIVFVHQCDFTSCYDEIYGSITANLFLEEYSSYDIFKTTSFTIHNIYGNDLSEIILKTNQLFIEPDLIIGCNSPQCLDAVLNKFTGKDIPIFYLGESNGETCQKNLFHLGKIIEPRYEQLVEFLQERKFTSLIYIYNEYLFKAFLVYFYEILIIILR